MGVMPPGAPAATTRQPERLVVAHRGASGYLPEHTLAAYELAVAQGADYLEPDLVVSADGQLVVRHENEIGATTDVARHPELADRRTTKVVDGVERTGWFTEDLTLAELRTLRARERLPALRPGGAVFDGAFPVLGFEEVLDLARRSRTTSGRPVGVLVELKHATYYAERGLDMVPRVLAALKDAGFTEADDPVILQSFETTCLRRLAEVSPFRLGQLLEAGAGPYDLLAAGDLRSSADLVTPAGLAWISRYADVVGLDKSLVIPCDPQGRLLAPTGVTTAAHDVGLEVFGWTFRRENRFLPAEFRRGAEPGGPGDLAGEITAFLAAGLDSVITDHPDLARFAPLAEPVRAHAAAA